MSRKFRKIGQIILVVLLSVSLVATPAMAGTMVAKIIGDNAEGNSCEHCEAIMKDIKNNSKLKGLIEKYEPHGKQANEGKVKEIKELKGGTKEKN